MSDTRRWFIAITQRMPSIRCVNAFAEDILLRTLHGNRRRTSHSNRHILFVSKLFLSGFCADTFSSALGPLRSVHIWIRFYLFVPTSILSHTIAYVYRARLSHVVNVRRQRRRLAAGARSDILCETWIMAAEWQTIERERERAFTLFGLYIRINIKFECCFACSVLAVAYGIRAKRPQRSHNFQQQTTPATTTLRTKKSVITKRFVVKLCVEYQFYGNESRVDAKAQFICFNMSFISGMRCEHWTYYYIRAAAAPTAHLTQMTIYEKYFCRICFCMLYVYMRHDKGHKETTKTARYVYEKWND